MPRRLLSLLFDFVKPLWWSLSLCAITGVLCLVVAYLIVWPAYQNPIARMYTSKLGYSSIIRKTGAAFPVSGAQVERREIVGKFVGEGLMQSEPVQVPMVAIARINKVNAVEGQRVRAGEVIVELDRTKVDLKIESAKAAIQTARAELERVRLGTVNVLQQERPDILTLQAEMAQAEAELARQMNEMNEKLRKSSVISKVELLEGQVAAIRSELMRQEKRLMADFALKGKESSIEIAESAIREAELTLEHRLSEIQDYTSLSPANGIVERVLVHAGEYNQDPGRPAVLLACGLWFECYLDQTALGRVQVGDAVEVRLSAYQDHVFQGRITHVRPLVNFALGGPETNRPTRPLGTGAPEWPSTFSVRVELDESGYTVVPGLTGYATVIQKRVALAVPRGTVGAVSGNRGIVFVVGTDGRSFEPRNVVTGIVDDQWVEIREGLQEHQIVIADGYQVLQPGDRIAVSLPKPHPVDAEGNLKLRYVGAAGNNAQNRVDHRGRSAVPEYSRSAPITPSARETQPHDAPTP